MQWTTATISLSYEPIHALFHEQMIHRKTFQAKLFLDLRLNKQSLRFCQADFSNDEEKTIGKRSEGSKLKSNVAKKKQFATFGKRVD